MKFIKEYKLFEAYPPSRFEIEAERKFREILPDLEDILLEVLDLGVKWDISKHISHGAFEVSIDIMKIKTEQQKKVVGEAVARINDYLTQSGGEFSSAEIHQDIETTRDLGLGLPEPSRGVKREIFYVYDKNEVIDLLDHTGELGLTIDWFWNTDTALGEV